MAGELSAALNLPEQERLGAELVPRFWAMDHVDRWLAGDDSRIFLVTGPPGTGKTSLVAQLVMLQEGALRSADHPRLASAELVLAHFCDASNERTLDPLDFIGALSNGLAAVVPGFAHALATATAATSVVISVNSTQNITVVQPGASVTNVKISVPRDVPSRQAFAYLVRRPLEAAVADGWDRQLLVFVDDLSGGYRYDAEDNIARLIAAVADNPKELPSCLRFVVTSRPDPWVLRDLPAPALDLLADQPADHEDIHQYAARRLAGLDGPLRHEWTAYVTEAAEGNFLYARHALDHLVADEAVLAAGPANHKLPASLVDLYRTWFKGGIARHKDLWWNCFQPVLTALTVARGGGLTLAQVAGITGLAASKVRRAFEESSQYLLGTLPGGPVRLYHDSFREFLASEEVSEDEGHRAIVDYFVRTYADGWLEADDYARDHLATHAAYVGELPELVRRADFLAVTEPTTLLHWLSRLDVDGDRNVEVYRRTGWLLADRHLGDRAGYLELAALEMGEVNLANQFGGLELPRGWRARWASLLRHRPSRVVGGHPGGALAMLPLQFTDGSTIVATLSQASELRLWDLGSHVLIDTLTLTPRSLTTSLAMLPTIDSVRIVAAGPRTVWLVDPIRVEVVGTLTGRPNAVITAITTVLDGDRPVLVIGYDDGVLDAVDPDSGQSIGTPVKAHDGPVLSLVAAYADGVWSGGVDGTICLRGRHAGTFTDSLETIDGAAGWIGACAFLTEERGWVLGVGMNDGLVAWLQEVDGQRRQHHAEAHQPSSWRCGYHAIGSDGRYSIVLYEYSGFSTFAEVLRRHRESEAERQQRERGQPWEHGGADQGDNVVSDDRTTPDDRPSSGEAAPDEDRRIVRMSGGVNAVDLFPFEERALLASGGEDGAIHLFDLASDPPSWDNVMPSGQPVSSIQFARVHGRAVLLAAESGEAGAIREWPLRPGGNPTPPLIGDSEQTIVHVSHATDADGRPIIATLSSDGSVLLRDAASGRPVADPLVGTDLLAQGVHLTWCREDLILVVYGRDVLDEDGTSHGAVRLWRLRDGASFATHEARFAALATVTAAVGVERAGGIVVAGEVSAEDGNPLWLLTERDGEWHSTPIQPTMSDEILLDDLLYPSELVAAPAAGDRIVFVREDIGSIYELSLNDNTVTERDEFSMDAVNAVCYRSGTALLSSNGSVVHLASSASEQRMAYSDAGGDVAVVADAPEAALVVAGTTDGRLVIWRSPGAPDQVIQLSATAMQVAAWDDGTILVRTGLGLLCLRAEPPA